MSKESHPLHKPSNQTPMSDQVVFGTVTPINLTAETTPTKTIQTTIQEKLTHEDDRADKTLPTYISKAQQELERNQRDDRANETYISKAQQELEKKQRADALARTLANDDFANALNTEILAKQQELIQNEAIKKSRNSKKRKRLSTTPKLGNEYLNTKKGKKRAAKATENSSVQEKMYKIEAEGYTAIQKQFADSLAPIDWGKPALLPPEARVENYSRHTTEIKNGANEVVCKLTETTITANTTITLNDGGTQEVSGYRHIKFPLSLEENRGPMHLLMAAKAADGQNAPKDNGTYFSVNYNEAGQLVSMLPSKVKFMKKGPYENHEAIGFIERNGQIYTLPITQGDYNRMQAEITRNNGLDTAQNLNIEASSAKKKSPLSKLKPARIFSGIKKKTNPSEKNNALLKAVKKTLANKGASATRPSVATVETSINTTAPAATVQNETTQVPPVSTEGKPLAPTTPNVPFAWVKSPELKTSPYTHINIPLPQFSSENVDAQQGSNSTDSTTNTLVAPTPVPEQASKTAPEDTDAILEQLLKELSAPSQPKATDPLNEINLLMEKLNSVPTPVKDATIPPNFVGAKPPKSIKDTVKNAPQPAETQAELDKMFEGLLDQINSYMGEKNSVKDSAKPSEGHAQLDKLIYDLERPLRAAEKKSQNSSGDKPLHIEKFLGIQAPDQSQNIAAQGNSTTNKNLAQNPKPTAETIAAAKTIIDKLPNSIGATKNRGGAIDRPSSTPPVPGHNRNDPGRG